MSLIVPPLLRLTLLYSVLLPRPPSFFHPHYPPSLVVALPSQTAARQQLHHHYRYIRATALPSQSDRTEVTPEREFIAIFLTLIIFLNPLKVFLYTATFISLYVVLVVTKFEVKLFVPNMESKATDLLAILKSSNHSIETKITHLASIKSDIKQKNVPYGAVSSIFESLRLSIASQHFSLLGAGFSTFGHFLKRLFIQDQHDLVSGQASHFCPLLLERFGDHKERVRAQAAQAFTDLWPAASAEVEHCVLEIALAGKNPRAREMSMIWLSNMTKSHGLLFRAYVPSLVACLEDADSAVRETAKTTVVELFQNAPARAKSDLKKQLAVNNVRRSISNVILVGIGLSSEHEHSASRPASRVENPHQRPASVMSSRSEHVAEPSKEDGEPATVKAKTAVPSKRAQRRPSGGEPHDPTQEHPDPSAPSRIPPECEKLEPIIIASPREIDEMVNTMLFHFEGRESDDNWLAREKDVYALRRLTRGNAPHDFLPQYMAAIKSLLDGVFKVVTSLRTTVSSNGCLFIQDLAKTCHGQIDPMVEIMMQNLLKICGGMKKITAQAGSTTVDVVIDNVSYSSRILQHVSGASHDKNTQLRLHAAGWLKTLINKQAGHKSSLEHNGGLDVLEKSIKKGLADANPGVREKMRITFWVFFDVFPEKANEILSAMDAKSRSLLEKASGRPDLDLPPPKDNASSRKPPTSGTSATAGRPSIKEAIAAQKKARQAQAKAVPARPEASRQPSTKAPPARPESAQSALSGAKTPDAAPKPGRVIRGQHISSLSSAPVRPAMKPRRPELGRPATAEPYDRPTSKQVKPKKLDIATKSHDAHEPASPSSTVVHHPTENTLLPVNKADEPSVEHLAKDSLPPMDKVDEPSVEHLAKDSLPPMDKVDEPSVEHLAKDTLPSKNKVDEPSVEYLAKDTLPPKNKVDEPTRIAEDAHPRLNNGDEPTSEHLNEDTLPSMNKADEIAFDHFAENTPPPNSEVLKTSTDQRVVSRPNNALEELHTDEPAHRDNKQLQVAATSRRSSGKIIPPPTQAAEEPTHSDNGLPRASVSRRRSSGSTIQPPTEPAEEPTHPDNKLPPLGVTRRRSSGGMIQPPIKPADDPNRRRWRKIEATEKRRTISPRSKDPEAAREMIHKGIERISKDTMDVVAYRKLQGLIEHHDDMFGDEELFDRLLMTLLEAMERPASKKVGFLGRPLDLSTQVLLTIRFMFWNCKKYFSAYYPRAMAALVSARRNYGGNCHIVSGLEDTVEDIAGVCKAGDALDAVLDVIVAEEKDEQGYPVINLGVFAATAILSDVHTRLPNRLVGRIGKFCGEVLAGSRLDARRSVTLLCINLHSLVTPPEANFWQALGTLREDSRNMLSYYIGRQ